MMKKACPVSLCGSSLNQTIQPNSNHTNSSAKMHDSTWKTTHENTTLGYINLEKMLPLYKSLISYPVRKGSQDMQSYHNCLGDRCVCFSKPGTGRKRQPAIEAEIKLESCTHFFELFKMYPRDVFPSFVRKVLKSVMGSFESQKTEDSLHADAMSQRLLFALGC